MNSLLACPKCGYERNKNDDGPLSECSKCGIIFSKYRSKPSGTTDATDAQAKPKSKGGGSVFVAIIVVLGIGYQLSNIAGKQMAAEDPMKAIYQKVSIDAEIQYNMVVKNGSPVDQCVHAGMVAATHLQANDEQKYKHWKDIEKQDCTIARVPR